MLWWLSGVHFGWHNGPKTLEVESGLTIAVVR